LTLSWTNQGGKEIVKQYKNADLRGEQGQQSSSSIIGGSSNTLSQTTEATTAATDTSFAAKALQFLAYCNNQFSQTPVSSMTTDTLVFCTMVYDWYLMGCNNTILAPIIAAQCKDPVIMQQIINYKTQINIRLKQIVKIEVPPPRDGGGNGGKLRDLTISIKIANPIVRGNTQTITVTVSDTNTKSPVSGVSVFIIVTYASGSTTKSFSGTTDNSESSLSLFQ
jgi:hypothetical protein